MVKHVDFYNNRILSWAPGDKVVPWENTQMLNEDFAYLHIANMGIWVRKGGTTHTLSMKKILLLPILTVNSDCNTQTECSGQNMRHQIVYWHLATNVFFYQVLLSVQMNVQYHSTTHCLMRKLYNKTHKHILEFSLLHAYFIPSKNKIQWHNLIKLAKIVQICLFNVTVNTRLCFQRKHVLKEYSAVSRQQGLSLYIISQVFIPPPEVIQRARDYPVTEQWLHFSTAPGNLDVLGIICLLGF